MCGAITRSSRSRCLTKLGRYLAVAAAQYGVTAASTALLPHALGVSTEIVYLVTVAVVVSVNFLVFRHGIFHAKPEASATRGTPGSLKPERSAANRRTVLLSI